MSEEEREILQGLDDMKHLEINPEYKVRIINGILDLYNKEKEKNKELQIYMKEYLIPKSTINLVYISKDKIKDEVEYIRFMVDDDNKPYEIVKEVNLYLDLFLQELLEERN